MTSKDEDDRELRDIEKLGRLTEHLGPLLDTVADKVPALLRGIRQTIYGVDAGAEVGRAVGTFYKELRAAGIPEAEAMEMVRTYLRTVQDAVSGLAPGKGHDTDDED